MTVTTWEVFAFLLGAPVWGSIGACVVLFMQSIGDKLCAEAEVPSVHPPHPRAASRIAIFCQIYSERERQDAAHGPERDLPFAYPTLVYCDPERVHRSRYERRAREGVLAYADIFAEEFAEAVYARTPEERRAELVQLAAVSVKAIEAHDWQQVEAAKAKTGELEAKTGGST